METLAERIADTKRVPLAGTFVGALRQIARANNVDEDTVWHKWQEYAKQCEYGDQSPVLFEFCQWNSCGFGA